MLQHSRWSLRLIVTATARHARRFEDRRFSTAAVALPMARRRFSTPAPTSRFIYREYSTLSVDLYHKISNDTLEDILEEYELLSESIGSIDVELAQGVLTLVLPNIGTYVINKQPPNKQIWLSSPVSGPKRYDWIDGKWVYARDNSTIGDLLREETKSVTRAFDCDDISLKGVS